MKTLLFALLLSTSALTACVPPVMPVAPAGCSAADATLITNPDGTCFWVFMGC